MYDRKYTPELISSLKNNEIFVFGSNLAGNHAGGAARTARMRFGAVTGQGVGLQGQCYAIPTMHGGVDAIKPYVDEFIAFAKAHPELTFYVTPVGCGIAGFKPGQIAPLFDAAFSIRNIILPESFVYVINHARQLASETAGMVFHSIPLKFYDEDMKKAEGMTLDEKNEFFYKLKKEGRYHIKHESPVCDGYILNSDDRGHHKIALTDDRFAIAAVNKLYSAYWGWGLDFDCDILSVVPIEKGKGDGAEKNYGNFAVLLSDGKICYVWSESCIKPLFAAEDFIAVESGCGGLVFGLHRDGTLSVAFEENNPSLAAEVRLWSNVTRISSSRRHIVGLTADGDVLIAGERQHFEEAAGWKNIRKVYAFDVMPNFDQVFGIDKDGWLYVTGSPWNDARQYWRKLRAQYDVSDIISNHDATLVRFTDGSYRLITPHAMHNFEKDMEFIGRYNDFRFLAARGDTVVIVDRTGEFRVDENKTERKWLE